MSSWGVLTLAMMSEDDLCGQLDVPAGILIDNGVDEQGWLDDGDRYYALSHGRYQACRYRQHLERMHAPQFSGVKMAFVASVEDTGDTVTVGVYEPKQTTPGARIDGYREIDVVKGTRWPVDERAGFIQSVELSHGFAPVIEPIDTVTPPDAILRMTGDEL